MANKQTEPEVVEQPVAEPMLEAKKVEEPVAKRGKVVIAFSCPGRIEGEMEVSDKIHEKPDNLDIETWDGWFERGFLREV